jgi:hypothetical protein
LHALKIRSGVMIKSPSRRNSEHCFLTGQSVRWNHRILSR